MLNWIKAEKDLQKLVVPIVAWINELIHSADYYTGALNMTLQR